MATEIKTDRKNKSSTGLYISDTDKLTRDASEVGIGIVTILAALIGIWGIACLIGGIANEGLVELVQGWISAVTGH